MKKISSILLLGLTSLLAFTPHSGNAQAFNETLGTGALQSNTTGLTTSLLGTMRSSPIRLAAPTPRPVQLHSSITPTGNGNTASGMTALLYNTTGNENTASGTNTLYYNTTGYSNTASGVRALYQNTDGLL